MLFIRIMPLSTICLTDPVYPGLFYIHLFDSYIRKLTDGLTVKVSSKSLHSQTVRPRDLTF